MQQDKNLSQDQLDLLNGSDDIKELTVSEMFEIAGGQYGGGGGGGNGGGSGGGGNGGGYCWPTGSNC